MAARDPAKRPSRLRKTLLIIAAIVLAMFGVATGYTLLFSMGTTRPIEVAGSPDGADVLIATQGSKFKDAVVNGLLDHLKQQSAHVRVIDITALPGISEADWDVLVMIHTWEAGKPPAAVRTFVKRIQHRNKLVVLTTSGSGDFKLDGLDAISTASKMIDVPARLNEIIKRVDVVLSTRAEQSGDV